VGVFIMNNLRLLCEVVEEVSGKCINNARPLCKADDADIVINRSRILKLTS
jgi:hypothetical protein